MRPPCWSSARSTGPACARPAGQDWLHDGKISITSTNAADFNSWWRGHDTPGPYTETFVIDGHRTHYLSFGATWVKKNGQWVPQHAARTDPVAEQQSLYGWATWAALNNKLPAAVCGTSVTAQQLQAQVFAGAPAPATRGRREVRERVVPVG